MVNLLRDILKEFLELIKDYMGYWLFIIFGLFVFPFVTEYEIKTFYFWIGIGLGASGLLCLIAAISKTRANGIRRETNKNTEKVWNKLEGFIINNKIRWNLMKPQSDGAIYLIQTPKCPKCKIDLMIQDSPTEATYKCNSCNDEVKGKFRTTEIQLAEVKLSEEVDRLKKELEIK